MIPNAEWSAPVESLIITPAAANFCSTPDEELRLWRTDPSKLSLKEFGGGASHATRMVVGKWLMEWLRMTCEKDIGEPEDKQLSTVQHTNYQGYGKKMIIV